MAVVALAAFAFTAGAVVGGSVCFVLGFLHGGSR